MTQGAVMAMTNEAVSKLVEEIIKKYSWVKIDSPFTCVLYEVKPIPGSSADKILVQTSLRLAVREFLTAMHGGTYVAGKVLASDPKRTIVHQNY
jgi:hypothetical protein